MLKLYSLLSILCWTAVHANEGCVDIIADHPVCLFGQICDCAALITTTNPCGSTMTSAGQSVEVNELCPATCNACPEEDNDSNAQDELCQDELENHPLCLFAQLCDCELDILPTYACEDTITSPNGSVQVTQVCAATCDACDTIPTTASNEQDQAVIARPVHGHIPMGVIDGARSDVYYTVGQDKIDFVMHFPDTAVWVAFQFWGGDFRGITDGRLPAATSGFECLVDDQAETATDNKANHVHCRARRVRHLFTSHSALPGAASDLTSRASVTSCTADRALIQTDVGVPFCQYDPFDLSNSSLIISSTDVDSELVFVTDVLPTEAADMTDIAVTHHAENATYTAVWSRSRSYPWGLQGDGTTLSMRWAVSPRGASTWVEGDLQYHGYLGYQRWQRGTDYFFMKKEAQEAHDPKYLEEIHVNTAAYSEDELETRLAVFRTEPGQEGNDGKGAETSGVQATFISIVSLFISAGLAATVS